MKPNLKLAACAAIAAVAVAANSASHNDAPLINMDPPANITDVYAFIGLNSENQKVLNVVVALNPLEDPGNGVNYYRFDNNLLYSIHIAKPRIVNGRPVFNGETAIRYNFRFESSYKNQNTILSYGLGTEAGPVLSIGDARQNLLQTYSVWRIEGRRSTNLGRGVNLLVPPVNVGPRTTPNYFSGGELITGATTHAELDSYTRSSIFTLSDGTKVFAGQREDGFYADVPGIFDFLGVRTPGKDGLSGYNVHAIALQIPLNKVLSANENPMVGVYATTSRERVQIRGGQQNESGGGWVQVGRMGNPLFNETLVALKDKDRYNALPPTRDRSVFSTYAENCELAFLFNAIYGTSFAVNGRTDLVGIFMPDLIRVDTSTGAVPLAGEQNFNRLSFIGGDTVFSQYTNAQVPSGWPNGRRLGDDVVDIALTAVASGPSYSTITQVGDNVNSNDQAYNRVFPYAGTPFGGTTTTLHP